VPKVPSEIAGKKVEEIVKDWNTELEQRSQQFARHAQVLGEWDRHIRRNRATLLALEADLGREAAAQEAVEQKLDFIEVHQREIHDGLEVSHNT
jgi:nuclear pore complex protein Nup62